MYRVTPQVDRIRAVVLTTLNDRERDGCIVYLAMPPVVREETVILPRLTFTNATDGYLTFVDLEPRANWTHACCYICVDQETYEGFRIDARFPPFNSGNRGQRQWRVIYRAPGVPGAFSAVPET